MMQYLGYAQGVPILHTLSSDFKVADQARRRYANAYHVNDSQTVLLNETTLMHLTQQYGLADLKWDAKYTYDYYRQLIDQNELKLRQEIDGQVAQLQPTSANLWQQYLVAHGFKRPLKNFVTPNQFFFVMLALLVLLVVGLFISPVLLSHPDVVWLKIQQNWLWIMGGIVMVVGLVTAIVLDGYKEFKSQFQQQKVDRIVQTLTQQYRDQKLIPYGKA